MEMAWWTDTDLPPPGVIERRSGFEKKISTFGTETLSAAVGTGLAPADAQGAADECLGFANGTPARRPLPCFRLALLTEVVAALGT